MKYKEWKGRNDKDTRGVWSSLTQISWMHGFNHAYNQIYLFLLPLNLVSSPFDLSNEEFIKERMLVHPRSAHLTPRH